MKKEHFEPGQKGRIKSSLNNIEFDSNEEREFFEWLLELYKVIGDDKLYAPDGIANFGYHTESYLLADSVEVEYYKLLKTKAKRATKAILQSLKYTPDFIFYLPEKFAIYFRDKLNIFPVNLTVLRNHSTYIVDVKGVWGGRYNDDKYFSAIRKIVLETRGDFVNKVVPVKLFKKTFCPESLRYMKNRKVLTERKNCIGLPTAQEFAAKVDEYYRKFMELAKDE